MNSSRARRGWHYLVFLCHALFCFMLRYVLIELFHTIQLLFLFIQWIKMYTVHLFSLFPVICSQLPVTRTFFYFPWRFELSGFDCPYGMYGMHFNSASHFCHIFICIVTLKRKHLVTTKTYAFLLSRLRSTKILIKMFRLTTRPNYEHSVLTFFTVFWDQCMCLGNCPPTPPET